MQTPFFITGIGTDVGKTVAAAVLVEALQAAYWKPVQAGYAAGTDTQTVQQLVADPAIRFFPETYRLSMPASPHIAAREEATNISIDRIRDQADTILGTIGEQPLLIEGAGGLMVPLNEHVFIADLALRLNAKVILVSRHYLGSINHSLLTAARCKEMGLQVAGWVFNDDYLNYADEIVQWSGYPFLAAIPAMETITPEKIQQLARQLRPLLREKLNLQQGSDLSI